jgi:hypothetical protein
MMALGFAMAPVATAGKVVHVDGITSPQKCPATREPRFEPPSPRYVLCGRFLRQHRVAARSGRLTHLGRCREAGYSAFSYT